MLKKFSNYSTIKRALLICCGVLLITVLITGAVFAIYAVRANYIKTVGIRLTPSKDYYEKSIRYFLQNDPEWGDDLIGGSNRRMGSAGCLVSCVASALNDIGVQTTPKEVNSALSAVNGFQDADLIWYKINESFPKADYRYSRVFSSATIENDLQTDYFP